MGIVGDAPDVGGLGEGLLVHQQAHGLEAGLKAQRQHRFLEAHGALAHLAHLEGHVPAGSGDPVELGKHLTHDPGPVLQSPGHGDAPADGLRRPARRTSSI